MDSPMGVAKVTHAEASEEEEEEEDSYLYFKVLRRIADASTLLSSCVQNTPPGSGRWARSRQRSISTKPGDHLRRRANDALPKPYAGLRYVPCERERERERAQTRFPLRNTSKYLQSSGIRGILWETMKNRTAAAQEET